MPKFEPQPENPNPAILVPIGETNKDEEGGKDIISLVYDLEGRYYGLDRTHVPPDKEEEKSGRS